MQNDFYRIKKIKKFFLDNAYKNNIGHLPSSLSCLEILYVLHNKIANITKENITDKIRDRVIMSKEHGRYGQLCVLVENGLLDESVMSTFMKDGGYCGHDIYNWVGNEKIAALDISSGALGHGLGVGVGLALTAPQNNIYVIVGDGELQEGSCWEALMFIGHNKINNLTVIIDKNFTQIDNLTEQIIHTSEFAADAISSFKFDVLKCDGHNIEQLENVFKQKTQLPKCIIANTIKGKELLFKQKEVGYTLSHYEPLSAEEYKKAVKEFENDPI